MRTDFARAGLLLTLSWAMTSPAAADDREDCFSLGASSSNFLHADARGSAIAACTRLMKTKRYEGAKARATVYSARGSWKHKSKMYDEALADYDQAVSLDPSNVEFYDYRADTWGAKGDTDRALANYDQAIRVDPSYAAAYFSRGGIYERKGDKARARSDYAAALAAPPRNAIARWAHREALLAMGRLDGMDEAIKTLSQRIERSPSDLFLYDIRGQAYAYKDDNDRAIADFSEVLRRDPKFSGVLRRRGIAHRSKGEYDQALADLDSAIRLDSKDNEAIVARAGVYRLKKDYDRAISDYSEAIRIEPASGYFNSRGYTYYLKGDVDRAIADYSEALRLKADFATALRNRGDAYSQKQNYERAIADFSEAIRLEPAQAATYWSRGRLQFYAANFGSAASDLSRYVKENPAYAYSAIWLYLARARTGDKAGAAELEAGMAKMKKAEWPYPVVEYLAGRRTAEALTAAASQPDERCEAQFYLGEAALARGEREAAVRSLKAAAETCPKSYIEFEGAAAELKRLGQ